MQSMLSPPSEHYSVNPRMGNEQLQSTAAAAPLIKFKEKALHYLTQTVKGFALILMAVCAEQKCLAPSAIQDWKLKNSTPV